MDRTPGDKMQGTIAQLLSITAYGNQFLSGHLDEGFFPEHSVFQFCNFVKFVDLQSSEAQWLEKEFAADPIAWFQKLKAIEVIQLRVRYISTNDRGISDRMSVAFVGGGGRWLIEAVKPSRSDFWVAKWEVGDRDDPDRQIWNVKYERILQDSHRSEQPLPSAEDVKDQLKITLQKISEFAHKNDCSGFGKCFDRAINALTEQPSRRDGEYELFPDGYAPPEYQQLLSACQSAWVFGGMGSWNDLWFDDGETNKEYDTLSDELFNLINLSLMVASNPFPRP